MLFEVKSLCLYDREGNILLSFVGTGGGVTSLTYAGFCNIIGVLEVEGLMNLTCRLLGTCFFLWVRGLRYSTIGILIGIVPMKINLIEWTWGSFFTFEVYSPNGLFRFFKVRDLTVGFGPFSVDVGTQSYIGPEVETWTCLKAILRTRGCLGRVVTRVTGASIVVISLQVEIFLKREAGTKLRRITIDRHAAEDDLCWEVILKVVWLAPR